MSETYAKARTYVDRGEVSTIFTRDSQSGSGAMHVANKPFEIALVRGKVFRYEFRDRDRSYVVWSDFTRTLTQWSVRPGLETSPSFGVAIAGATGVSSGSAHVTPVLLMPREVGGYSLVNLQEARVDGTELVGTHLCWKVVGIRRSTTQTLWIDATSFVLRKLVEHSVLAGFTTDETTTFDPVIEQPVPLVLLSPPS